jgi:hypothetical protein
MEKLLIDPSVKTPFVDFNAQTGEMIIQGRSIPQDSESFWEPILKWFYAYAVQPAQETNFIFDLEYFNISSSKRILFLLYKMAEMHENNFKINVEWRCKDGDIDMREVGNDYACMVNLPFKIVNSQPTHLVAVK